MNTKNIHALVEKQRKCFKSGATLDVKFRISQLIVTNQKIRSFRSYENCLKHKNYKLFVDLNYQFLKNKIKLI